MPAQPATPEIVAQPRLGLVSGGDDIRLRSYLNHYIWAAENSIDYRLEIGLAPSQHLPYDTKYTILRRVIPQYEWTLWVDDDVFFTNWSADGIRMLIQEAIAADQFLVIAEGPMEPTGIWSKVNSGVLLFRDDPRTWELLDRARGTDLDQLRTTWDFEHDGLFSGGDQDAIWNAIKTVPELSAGTRIVGHAQLNSRPHLITGDPSEVLTAHFCGPHKPMRVNAYAREHGLGLELVPDELLTKYSSRGQQKPQLTRYAVGRVRSDLDNVLTKVRKKAKFVRETRRWR